ncbi:MAG: hypothetical protein ISR65_18720 [Bacteriovoracaceae bacterium]|nr:hypothetical protein [Bacteriovoracaceae bacterium]
MNRFFLALCLVMMTQLLFAQDPAQKKALVVGLGGYNSCSNDYDGPAPYGMGLSRGVQELIESIKQASPDTKVDYLLACLGDGAPPWVRAAIVTSKNPDYSEGIRSRSIGPAIKDLLDDPTTPVYIVGHSYGGWLSLHLTLVQFAPKDVNVAGVFTIDPIDPQLCDSSMMGKMIAMMNIMMGMFMGGGQCYGAPRDIPLDRAESISNWLNFYQQEASLIRSAAIRGAKNHYLSGYGRRGHTLIARDRRVWEMIEEEVVK